MASYLERDGKVIYGSAKPYTYNYPKDFSESIGVTRFIAVVDILQSM
jgi:hypothetical protein